MRYQTIVLLLVSVVVLGVMSILATLSGRESRDNRRVVILIPTNDECRGGDPTYLPNFLPVPGYCLEGCGGMTWKTRCILAGLREIKRLGTATHVIFSDRDVFFSGWSQEKIFKVFDSFEFPLVVSAERNLWKTPFGGKMGYMVKDGSYVNSGAHMGEIDYMIQAFEEMRDAQIDFQSGALPVGKPIAFGGSLYHKKEQGDDQTLFNLYMNAHFNKTMTIDIERKMFFSIVDLLAERCQKESSGFQFKVPVDEWDESWCKGIYPKKKRKPNGPLNSIRPDWRYCYSPDKYIGDNCSDEWGIDETCRAFVNGRSHDAALSHDMEPLMIHLDLKLYKIYLPQLREKWRLRCSSLLGLGHQYTIINLLEIEEIQRRQGLRVPINDFIRP